MKAKTVEFHLITCPHLGMKQDKSTAYAYPSPGNICHNCKIPTAPSEAHQEKFCLTKARNECPVYSQEKNKPFPHNLELIGSAKQNSLDRWSILLWILLGVILTIIIYNLVSTYLIAGKF